MSQDDQTPDHQAALPPTEADRPSEEADRPSEEDGRPPASGDSASTATGASRPTAAGASRPTAAGGSRPAVPAQGSGERRQNPPRSWPPPQPGQAVGRVGPPEPPEPADDLASQDSPAARPAEPNPFAVRPAGSPPDANTQTPGRVDPVSRPRATWGSSGEKAAAKRTEPAAGRAADRWRTGPGSGGEGEHQQERQRRLLRRLRVATIVGAVAVPLAVLAPPAGALLGAIALRRGVRLGRVARQAGMPRSAALLAVSTGATALVLATIATITLLLIGREVRDYAACLQGANTITAEQTCRDGLRDGIQRRFG